MSKSSVFLKLAPKDRIRVGMAVLLDGGEAPVYLMNDERRGGDLNAAAQELLNMELDVRFPYIGTIIRRALEEEA
jgi:hypothetical protein